MKLRERTPADAIGGQWCGEAVGFAAWSRREGRPQTRVSLDRLGAVPLDPLVKVVTVEAQQVTYLDEADSPLGNQSPDVARRYSEALGHLLDTEESLFAVCLHVALRRVPLVLTNPHATAGQRYKPLRNRDRHGSGGNVATSLSINQRGVDVVGMDQIGHGWLEAVDRWGVSGGR
jgi:hypothetical protein